MALRKTLHLTRHIICLRCSGAIIRSQYGLIVPNRLLSNVTRPIYLPNYYSCISYDKYHAPRLRFITNELLSVAYQRQFVAHARFLATVTNSIPRQKIKDPSGKTHMNSSNETEGNLEQRRTLSNDNTKTINLETSNSKREKNINSNDDIVSSNRTKSPLPSSAADIPVNITDIQTKINPNSSENSKLVKINTLPIKVSNDLMVSKLKSEELPSSFQRYFLSRYFTFLERFQESLANELPETVKMFKIFSSGIKEFILDLRDYIGILLSLSLPGERLIKLSRRELELYYHMPKDMIRVFPMLSVSSIPLGQNVAFPVAYMFPRLLLCRHFWTPEQRHEFATLKLKKRLFNARRVFRYLQNYLEDIKDVKLHDTCEKVFLKLGSGIHPTVEEIADLIPLFRDGPYHLTDVQGGHLSALLRLNGRSALPFRKIRLRDHANYIHLLDKAIKREDMNYLNMEKLSECLFIRGVNPTGLSRDKMIEILEKWLFISEKLEGDTFSFLVHLPIFIAYNHPTNLALIN